MIITCKFCNEVKSVVDPRANFCSPRCGGKHSEKIKRESGYYEKKRFGVYTKCRGCQIEIYRHPSQIKTNQHFFCTQKCYFSTQGTWIKGKTKETDERVKKQGESISRYLKAHPIKRKQRKVTYIEFECKQCKIISQKRPYEEKKYCSSECWKEYRKDFYSKLATKTNNKFSRNTKKRCKWFEHTRPDGTIINLQGSFELKLAQILDEEKISYIPKYKSFQFVNPITSNTTRYTPDFYIPSYDLYIETKGYWWEEEKKRFEAFKKTYPEIRIEVLMEKELFSIPVKDLIRIFSGRSVVVNAPVLGTGDPGCEPQRPDHLK